MIPGLRRGAVRAAREAIIQHLKTHPYLCNQRTVKTWMFWDGKASVAPPAVGNMPACQVRMIGGPSTPMASTRVPGGPNTQAIKSTAMVIFELWTKGTDQGDAEDLGEAIFDVLFPQGEERARTDRIFADAAIRSRTMSRMIQPPSGDAFNTEYVYAQGVMDIEMHFNS